MVSQSFPLANDICFPYDITLALKNSDASARYYIIYKMGMLGKMVVLVSTNVIVLLEAENGLGRFGTRYAHHLQ